MSKVQLQGNASGTGIFTIASPNSNTDRTLTLPDQTGTLLSSSAQGIPKSALPTGSVLQVVQVVKSDTFSTSSDSLVDITGFSASITPTSASSKILMYFAMNLRATGNQGYTTIAVNKGATQLLTGYAIEGNAADSRGQICWVYLDSPATTSSVTYTGRISAEFADVAYLNSTTSPSTITLMEIAA